MLDLFLGLKRLIKRRIIHIDNTVFRLHWQLTSVTLIAFSLIITTRQYVGSPIDCLQKDEIPENVLNTYCWIHSTFTIPSAFEKMVGKDVAHPGVDNSFHEESEKKYLTYYQWVCFSLFLQVGQIVALKMQFKLTLSLRNRGSSSTHPTTSGRFGKED